MIKIEKEKQEVDVVKILICDCCGKEIYFDNLPEGVDEWNNIIEQQEYYTIAFQAGFGSPFGDGNQIRCDLCKNCLFNLIKDFVQVIDQG